jgi:hypothetical protein
VITWMEDGLVDLLRMSWFTGWFLPGALGLIAGSARAMAKPGGPTIYAIIFRRPTVPRSDRAIGFDLMFAALGSQLGFVAVKAASGVPVRDIPFAGIWLALLLTVLAIPAIRIWGWEHIDPNDTTSDIQLREDRGVAWPNVIGTILLILIYNINT